MARSGLARLACAHGLGLAAVISAGLSGCVSFVKEDPAVADAAALPVTCFSRDDCNAKWARARVWLAAHTVRPVTVSDTALKTAEPTAADPSPAFEVTFTAHSANEAVIGFAATCRGACRPSEQDMLGDFNLYLSASNPASLEPMAPARKP